MPLRTRVAKLPSTGRILEVRSPPEILAAFEAHRLDRRLSQLDLAERAGTGMHSYQAWARGETRAPTLNAIFAYARTLGLRLVLAPKPKEPAA